MSFANSPFNIAGAASGQGSSISNSTKSDSKFTPPAGLFKNALSASRLAPTEKSGMDVDRTAGPSSTGDAGRSLRDRMGLANQNGRKISLNTPATIPIPSSRKTDMAGKELLPSSPQQKRRTAPPAGDRAGRGRGQRNGKPYDGKAKSGSSAGAKGALARMSGKNTQNPLPPRPAAVAAKSGKNARDWRVTKTKFFTEETKKWLERRYLGDNLIDLSALPKDEYLIKEGLPGLQTRSGTYYFKILNKFAQREGATPITKINLSGNALESLAPIKDFRWTLRQVYAIDLRDNPIKSINSLDDLMTKQELANETKPPTHPADITEIRLDGCLFREELMKTDEKKYFDEVMRRFPKLEHLDGHAVSQLRSILYPSAQPSQLPATTPTAAPMASIPDATPPVAPPNPQIDNPEYKEALIAAFSQQSGMNRDWTVLCLEGNGWDGERAWADYETKKATIPPEAYVKA